jgi:hypothetical protein
MFTSNKKFDVGPGARIQIRADGPFMVYTIEKGKRDQVVGPFNREQWYLRTVLPIHVTKIEVVPKEETGYNIEITQLPSAKSINNGEPVEIPLDCRRPQTTEQLVAKYVSEAIYRQQERDGYESPEEADDFEMDIEDPLSQYELQEMQSEQPLERPRNGAMKKAEPDHQKEEKPSEIASAEASEEVTQQSTA